MFFRGKRSSVSAPSGHDWAAQGADFIERLVDTVSDKAVVPLQTAVRAIVFGLVAAFVGTAAFALTTIGLLRLANIYLNNIPHIPHGVWLPYAVIGGIFLLLGLYLWSKRSPSRPPV